MIRIGNIKLFLDDDELMLKEKAARILKINAKEIKSLSISKRSIDARDKNDVKYVYSVDVKLSTYLEKKCLNINGVAKILPNVFFIEKINVSPKHRPIVVGSGPAGMFAALILAEAGLKPVILERGKAVDERMQDVNSFWDKRILDENSNVAFGEGGAGTFSDGKLTTGIKDIRIWKVISELIEAGAPNEISYIFKPHIGTDNLVNVVKNIRQKIISLGGEYLFNCKLYDFSHDNNGITTIKTENEKGFEDFCTDRLILAIGHSSRDTVEMLFKNGIHMEAKPFAVGVRIEHKQKIINDSQYGRFSKYLGAADYKLNVHLKNGRGVYTFCMCPGGVVVGAASEKNTVVTNGMSYYKRDFENANAGVLVSVNPVDFKSDSPLGGIEFQRRLENNAFIAGGGNYNAPIQYLQEFLSNNKYVSKNKIEATYKPGVTVTDLRECLDEFIIESLKEAICLMDKKLRGFASEGVLTGVETRSSSPVTIKRNVQSLESNIKGIYPCGEGAGFAGGIISAAVDGIKCAQKCIETLANTTNI